MRTDVEPVYEGCAGWDEWVVYVDATLDTLEEGDLAGLEAVSVATEDPCLTIPRWYIDDYLGRRVGG